MWTEGDGIDQRKKKKLKSTKQKYLPTMWPFNGKLWFFFDFFFKLKKIPWNSRSHNKSSGLTFLPPSEAFGCITTWTSSPRRSRMELLQLQLQRLHLELLKKSLVWMVTFHHRLQWSCLPQLPTSSNLALCLFQPSAKKTKTKKLILPVSEGRALWAICDVTKGS